MYKYSERALALELEWHCATIESSLHAHVCIKIELIIRGRVAVQTLRGPKPDGRSPLYTSHYYLTRFHDLDRKSVV